VKIAVNRDANIQSVMKRVAVLILKILAMQMGGEIIHQQSISLIKRIVVREFLHAQIIVI
jgi:hypothetical protein